MREPGQVPTSSPGRWRESLDVLVKVAFIAAAGALIYATVVRPDRPPLAPVQGQRTDQPPTPVDLPLPAEPISLHEAARRGDPGARVALVEYSDFECPFCSRFARETLPVLDEKYIRPGKVLFAFRHLPLSIHALAQQAAEAAECAGRQGRFWEMHDLLFEQPRQIGAEQVRARAVQLRLDSKAFDACLGGEAAEKVKADLASSRELSITGTPAFLFGIVQGDGRVKVTDRVSGAQRAAVFEAVLERLLGDVEKGATSAGSRR